MTTTSRLQQRPVRVQVRTPTDPQQLLIHGQGVVLFDASGPCSLTFRDASGVAGLLVEFTEHAVHPVLAQTHTPLPDPTNTKGLVPQCGATYWFSLNSQTQRLVAGVGEARMETATYSFTFPDTETRPATKRLLEGLTTVQGDGLRITSLLRDPITRTVPLHVKHTNNLTMAMIAAGSVLPHANLSPVAQMLYNCIAGNQFHLATPDFPEFAKAIQYSIVTPGKWCYECLKRKATEFDKDKPNEKETYLRITLNENTGESPGIPYVMEIWPVGHYSPIHNHGGSSAIIRVLHGSIHVSLFPFLSGDELEPFATADFQKGDITWISPTLNQVHQLHNLETNKDPCITIQCYMYEKEDTTHYDYFDYLDADGVKQQFEPNSDMDFLEFKRVIQEEWKTRPRSWFGCRSV